jgi:hypothetical protein
VADRTGADLFTEPGWGRPPRGLGDDRAERARHERTLARLDDLPQSSRTYVRMRGGQAISPTHTAH